MAPTVTFGERTVTLSPRMGWRWLRADVASMPRALKLWFAFLLVLLAIGAFGAIFSLNPGDEVFGTRPSFEWGILITAYVFFAITTSGLCLASSLGTVFGIERFRAGLEAGSGAAGDGEPQAFRCGERAETSGDESRHGRIAGADGAPRRDGGGRGEPGRVPVGEQCAARPE